MGGCDWEDQSCVPEGATSMCGSLQRKQCKNADACDWDRGACIADSAGRRRRIIEKHLRGRKVPLN
jgi:hypothetical protein